MGEPQNSASASDLDVVGMASEAEDLKGPAAGSSQFEPNHTPAVTAVKPVVMQEAARFHTFQGAAP